MINISSEAKLNLNIIIPGYEYILNYPCTNNDCYPYKVELKKGKYFIKCWGASGTDIEDVNKARGAFVSGIITLFRPTILYFYLGNIGSKGDHESFNGGGKGTELGASGGGATDVRLTNGSSNNFESLLSRIMVAAGAGGYNSYEGQYEIFTCGNGNGGTITGDCGYLTNVIGYNNNLTYSYGGTQTSGGLGSFCAIPTCLHNDETHYYGSFGKGQDSVSNDWSGGGGGGYFGGGAGAANHNIIGSGAGGSSFVSGCEKCVAVSHESKDEKHIEFLKSNIHYSGLYFTHIEMEDGYQEMIEPDGNLKNGHWIY